MSAVLDRVIKWLLCTYVALSLVYPLAVYASPPSIISYQGLLTDNTSNPASGNHDIRVRFYSALTGGTLYYEEQFNTIPVNSGVFGLNLGSGTPLIGSFSSIDFNNPIYITLNVKSSLSGSFDGEMNPRILLRSVPYAQNSNQLQGRTVGNGANNVLALDGTSSLSITNNLTAGGILTTGTGLIPITTTTGNLNANALTLADNSLQVTGTDLSVRLNPTGGLTTTSTGLSLLTTCTNNQVLQFNGGAWGCGVSGGAGWGLTGNAGTDGGITNFIGTTDAQNLSIRTNNIEQLNLSQTGRLTFANVPGNIFINGGNETATGGNNTAIGAGSQSAVTTGFNNISLGQNSLAFNTAGSGNLAIGQATLLFTQGDLNTAIGQGAGILSNGNLNTFVGYASGQGLVAGDNNLALGQNTSFINTSGSDQINIANIIFGTGANGVVSAPAGLIGIGTAAPTTKLEVDSGVLNSSGFKLTNLTSSTPTSTGQAIGVDASGNVVTVAAGVAGLTTANNGLTVNPAGNVQLGGSLIQNTTINQAGYGLSIEDGNRRLVSQTNLSVPIIGGGSITLPEFVGSQYQDITSSAVVGVGQNAGNYFAAIRSYQNSGGGVESDSFFQALPSGFSAGYNDTVGNGTSLIIGSTAELRNTGGGQSSFSALINGVVNVSASNGLKQVQFVQDSSGSSASSFWRVQDAGGDSGITLDTASARIFTQGGNRLVIDGAGDVQLTSYPSNRNDSISPVNVLSTDGSGYIISTPLTSIIPSPVNGIIPMPGNSFGLGGSLDQNTGISGNNFAFSMNSLTSYGISTNGLASLNLTTGATLAGDNVNVQGSNYTNIAGTNGITVSSSAGALILGGNTNTPGLSAIQVNANGNESTDFFKFNISTGTYSKQFGFYTGDASPISNSITTSSSPGSLYWQNNLGGQNSLWFNAGSTLGWDRVVTLTDLLANSSPITVQNTSSLFSTGLPNPAGVGATAATDSIFLGSFAGENATNSSNSVFIGLNAGFNATTSSGSNFFGSFAGYDAINASDSNFYGNSAGYQASFAGNSNFFGLQAGQGAINSSNANFFGRQAGLNAANANFSNFFGDQAGYDAAFATNSNFIGKFTGTNAINAYNSTFLGASAGYGATNANNSIFIGDLAGNGDLVNNSTPGSSSILIGDNTSTGGFSDSIALGAGAINTAANQFYIRDQITNFNLAGVNYNFPTTQATNPGDILSNDGAGNLSWSPAGTGTVTASNGLTAVGTDVRLGGILNQTTTITATGNDVLSISNGSQTNNSAAFNVSRIGSINGVGAAIAATAIVNSAPVSENIAGRFSAVSTNTGVATINYGILSTASTSNVVPSISNVGGRLVGSASAGTINQLYGVQGEASLTGGTANLVVGSSSVVQLQSGTSATNGVGVSANLTLNGTATIGKFTGFYMEDNNSGIANRAGLFLGTSSNANYTGEWGIYNALNRNNIINGSLTVGSTTAPTARLEVTSGVANNSGFKLTNLTSASPGGSGGVIGVDSSGTVVRLSGTSLGVPLNGITNATGSLAINHGANTIGWQWNSLTTQNAFNYSSSSITTGSLMDFSTFNAGLNSTNGLLSVRNQGTSISGTVFRVQSNGTDPSLGLSVMASGNIGIGTLSPSTRLQLTSDTANTSGLRLTNLTSASPTSTGQAIGVDASGNVVTIASSGAGCIPGGTGTLNTCLGLSALVSNTTGFQNTALGALAMQQNTTGFWNVAIGDSSLSSNQTGNSNVAIGSEALKVYTSNNATAVGNQALTANTTGYANTAFGANTAFNTTTGGFNTAVGAAALQTNTTGEFNTVLGIRAGYSIISGNNNIAIGADSDVLNPTGSNQLSIGNIIFGNGINGTVAAPAGNIGIGTTSPTNRLTVEDLATTSVSRFNGSGSTQCTVITGTGWSCSSDSRLKKNIQPLSPASNLLSQLNPVTYQWKQGSEDTQYGFIAQEVEQILPGLVSTNSDGYKSLNTQGITPYLVKAFQEQQQELDQIKQQLGLSTPISPTNTINPPELTAINNSLNIILSRLDLIEQKNVEQEEEIDILKEENATLKSKLDRIEEELLLLRQTKPNP